MDIEYEGDAARYVWHAGQAERLRRTRGELVDFHERPAEKLMNQTGRRETA
jgi:hypothetical protein